MSQEERVSFLIKIGQTIENQFTESNLLIGLGLSLFLLILGMNTLCSHLAKTGKPKNVKMDDLIDN